MGDLASTCKDKLAYFRIKDLKDVLIHLALPKHGAKKDLVDRILALLSQDQGQCHFGQGIKNVPSKETVAGVVDDIYRRKMQVEVHAPPDLLPQGQVAPDFSYLKRQKIKMDREVNTKHNTLERMLLDGSAEPIDLQLSLLEDITNCFSDDRQIGMGGFAVVYTRSWVYKGMVGNGMVAVKKLSRTFDMQENKFHKEVECLMKAKHKNIVRFLGYCSDTQGKIVEYEGKFVMADVRNWLLCFEYVPNGSLDKYIADASQGLTWKERYQIIKGICDGLCHLHEKRILHLDLKPSNILVDDRMVPKITDFGVSRCLDAEQTSVITSHLCGSQGYLPPEFYSGQITFASDIYSLGVIILEILTGKKGYSEDDNVVESWMNRLGESDEGEMQLKQVRVCTKIGIEGMDLDPKKRPVVRDIVDMLVKVASPDCLHETAIHISSDDLDASSLREQ